jgi:hypothetical protein
MSKAKAEPVQGPVVVIDCTPAPAELALPPEAKALAQAVKALVEARDLLARYEAAFGPLPEATPKRKRRKG